LGFFKTGENAILKNPYFLFVLKKKKKRKIKILFSAVESVKYANKVQEIVFKTNSQNKIFFS
jgi:hypothetical protein